MAKRKKHQWQIDLEIQQKRVSSQPKIPSDVKLKRMIQMEEDILSRRDGIILSHGIESLIAMLALKVTKTHD